MAPEAPKRQFVNFLCLKLDPAWHHLPELERKEGKAAFQRVVRDAQAKMLVLCYSTLGLRAEVDLILWRISYRMEDFEEMSAAMARTSLGRHLTTSHSFLSMTKRSVYVDKINPEHENIRSVIVPGKHKYIFIYPFVKTREWYLLPLEERQQMMDTHIQVGNKFPSVKLNTTYSFGLDDQDFVVAFESDQPGDFLDLVMALRETAGSRHTVRDTPILTGIHKTLEELLDVVA